MTNNNRIDDAIADASATLLTKEMIESKNWQEQIQAAQSEPTALIKWRRYQRIPYGNEKHPLQSGDQPCSGCGVIKGQYHVQDWCNLEECPRCGGALSSCFCNAMGSPLKKYTVFFHRDYPSDYIFTVEAESETVARDMAYRLLEQEDNIEHFASEVQTGDWFEDDEDRDEDGNLTESAFRRRSLKNWKDDAITEDCVGTVVGLRDKDLARLRYIPGWLRDYETGTTEFQGNPCTCFKLHEMTLGVFFSRMSTLFLRDWSLLILYKGAWRPFRLSFLQMATPPSTLSKDVTEDDHDVA
jgi:hypothetical protein